MGVKAAYTAGDRGTGTARSEEGTIEAIVHRDDSSKMSRQPCGVQAELSIQKVVLHRVQVIAGDVRLV